MIGRGDSDAYQYVEEICERAAQFIAGAFDVDGFDLLRSSFSMVSRKPSDLSDPQRAPSLRFNRPEILRAAALSSSARRHRHRLFSANVRPASSA
jgi:hypothetical protein